MCLTVTKTGKQFRQENPDLKTIKVFKLLWKISEREYRTPFEYYAVKLGETIYAARPLADPDPPRYSAIGPQGVHAYISTRSLAGFLSSEYLVAIECEIPVENIIAFGCLNDVALTHLDIPEHLTIVQDTLDPLQVEKYSVPN